MTTFAMIALGTAAALVLYTFALYPAILAVIGRRRSGDDPRPIPDTELPFLSITVPAYNEERQIADTLDALLALDYPPERRQILVVSDASADRTDDIVRGYADRGVELLSLADRHGKTAAEAAARPHLRGDLILNTDASVRLHPAAARQLVARFTDPTVGAASGRDVSVAHTGDDANIGESGYVGFEMGIRRLETRVTGIVGNSGCLYVIRRDLHLQPLPEGLSRDFGSALIAHEHGYRSVSVDSALCFVPRTTSLHREFSRKVRTVTRGIGTLLHKRHLMNPFSHGAFAWMLISHKLCRWLLPWALLAALLAVLVLAPTASWAAVTATGAFLLLLLAAAGWFWPQHRPIPRLLAVPAYFVIGNLATLIAWFRVARGRSDAVWEPTRRDAVDIRAA